MKCDDCLNARRIISENGFHSLCCLSERVAVDCITGKKDQKVSTTFISTDKTEKGVSNEPGCELNS